MKAIYPLSANPWHNGHSYVYDMACKMFGKKNVTVAIAINSAKSLEEHNQMRMHVLKRSITPVVRTEPVIITKAIADYCANHNIEILVRGVRTGYDLEYKLNYASWNKVLNPALSSVIIPCPPSLGHVSSTAIRELDNLGKNQELLQFMNQYIYYRWKNNNLPAGTIFFGKACIGKSTLINSIKDQRVTVDCDSRIWECLNSNAPKHEIKYKLQQAMKHKDREMFIRWIKCLTEYVNWDMFFREIFSFHFVPITWYDMVVLGLYWDHIPPQILANFELVKVYSNERNEFIKKRALEKGIPEKDLIERYKFLDSIYQDPPFWDREICSETGEERFATQTI